MTKTERCLALARQMDRWRDLALKRGDTAKAEEFARHAAKLRRAVLH